MTGSEVYILCEGFHDRALWKGLLTNLGCTSRGGPGKPPVVDPWGETVRGGQFAFASRNGGFIRVVPVQGKNQLRPFAKSRLKTRHQNPISYLIINHDSDQNADGTASTSKEITHDSILQLAHEFDPAAQNTGDHVIAMDNGNLNLVSFSWLSDAPAKTPGLPNQHTLERLICSAISAAYPDRSSPVETWLASRPSPPSSNPKEHAFSYLAGWYAETGDYQGFCEILWHDPKIANELSAQLQRQGVWQLLKKIAEIV